MSKLESEGFPILEQAEHTEQRGEAKIDRRQAITRVGIGVVGASLVTPAVMSVRALIPNALYERPLKFKAGPPDQFADGPTFLAAERVFIFKEGNTFYSIGAVCTHLGCTVQLVRGQGGKSGGQFEFHCPCHGSKFRADGTNYAGPAPRPLDYFKLDLAPDDGQLMVDLSQVTEKGWRFSV